MPSRLYYTLELLLSLLKLRAYLFLYCLHFICVLIEDVFPDKLWALEFLATEGAQVLAIGYLLSVQLDESLSLSTSAVKVNNNNNI